MICVLDDSWKKCKSYLVMCGFWFSWYVSFGDCLKRRFCWTASMGFYLSQINKIIDARRRTLANLAKRAAAEAAKLSLQ